MSDVANAVVVVVSDAGMTVTIQLDLLGPALLLLIPLGILSLLIVPLAFVAVYSPNPDRRAAAEKILGRLVGPVLGSRRFNGGMLRRRRRDHQGRRIRG